MTAPVWLVLLLGLGATLRVTRFFNSDVLTENLRVRVANRWGPDSLVSYLVTCGWCLSIYVAVPVAVWALAVLVAWAGLDGFTAAALFVPLALTYSYVTGLVSQNLDS